MCLCDAGKRVTNPEQVHGYSFNSKVVAVGSLVNSHLRYLTDEDAQKCAELGIYMETSGKLERAHESCE